MFRSVGSVLMVWIVLAVVGWGQMQSKAELMVVSSPQIARHNAIAHPLHTVAQRLQIQNSDRQEKLVADTNKLLALISSFNQQANKSDAVLSPAEAAKRAEEIERLARSVKDGMRE